MASGASYLNVRLWQLWETIGPGARSENLPLTLPQTVVGQLLNADHTPASEVLIVVRRPGYVEADMPMSNVPWPRPSTLTDQRGAFVLALPAFTLPAQLIFDVLAEKKPVVTFSVCGTELLGGMLGPVVLNANLSSYCPSAIRRMRSATPQNTLDQFHRAFESSSSNQPVALGDSDCSEQYYAQAGSLEEFPFAVLYRLVEPTVSPIGVSSATTHATGTPEPQSSDDNAETTNAVKQLAEAVIPLIPGAEAIVAANPGVVDNVVDKVIDLVETRLKEAESRISDLQSRLNSLEGDGRNGRVSIIAPLDIVTFKRQLLDDSKVKPLSIASSLGVGYLLQCKQTWRQGGLTLGNMLYSLPLAPGESQLIAVREIQQTTSFSEQEATQASENQQYQSADNSSDTAVFSTAYQEAAQQSSQYNANSRTTGSGGSSSSGLLGAVFGGGGSTSSVGETTTTGSFGAKQNLSRDYASAAAERLSNSVSRTHRAAGAALRGLDRRLRCG